MTRDAFRKLALSLPDAEERSHMHHPDFRVNDRIFATLDYPEIGWAMVALAPEDQKAFVAIDAAVFVPVKGKWGAGGATSVFLKKATAPVIREALRAAYEQKRAKARSKSPR